MTTARLTPIRRPQPSFGTGRIRPRLALLTSLAVLAAMLVGIAGVSVVLHRSLQYALMERAETQASAISSVLESRGVQGITAPSALDLLEGARVQVVDASGRLIYTSASSTSPLTSMRPPVGQLWVSGTTALPTLGDQHVKPLVVATTIQNGDAPQTIIVSRSPMAQHEAVASLVKILAAGLPFLLLATMAATWWLVGTSLRPVEAIRRKTAEITGGNLGERVPVPQTHDEVHALATTMNAMLERLDSASRAQARFVADASHELRSPLATVRGATQLGRRHGSEEWYELLPLVETESERLDRLVGDLLTLSKADDLGSIPLHLEDVDLDDLASGEAMRLRTSTGVAVELAVQPVRIQGDPQRLSQVLRNLGENAARAAATTVELRVQEAAGAAVLTVEDDGPGIPPDSRAAVFERFVRLDEARSRDAGGSGLGLAIVAEIVRAHRGSVQIGESPRWGGACLTVTLPLDPGDAPIASSRR